MFTLDFLLLLLLESLCTLSPLLLPPVLDPQFLGTSCSARNSQSPNLQPCITKVFMISVCVCSVCVQLSLCVYVLSTPVSRNDPSHDIYNIPANLACVAYSTPHRYSWGQVNASRALLHILQPLPSEGQHYVRW
jgi:hypothetical protein